MAHCPNCEDPECQGAVHRCEVVIDEDAFRRMLFLIKQGLENPDNPPALQLAGMALNQLKRYDTKESQ